ncbi:DNA repair protein RecO [Parvularcula sp. IMCC14364]|uniref:DNA repair protein RecO n=1 Tax=Parvularcula sp. IMCC14364 TaxID=3067902 RepID=UPI002740C66C|nr:DNA repair protein RecO [Parvularcula sp. IMCC14364]
MEWSDEAIILEAKPHGENHAVVNVFTPSAGRVAALVHGGQGRQKQPLLQVGNGVTVTWKGRSEDSLGHFAIELTSPRAASLMYNQLAVTALSAVTALLRLSLPERQSLPQLYEATSVMLDLLEEKDIWPVVLAKWELGLLSTLGFGLVLDECAATGLRLEDGAELVFVSPKSGNAVSYKAGLPYKDKMFPLPPFLIDQGEPVRQDIAAALRLTSHFIEERILFPADLQLPDARQRLQSRLERA